MSQKLTTKHRKLKFVNILMILCWTMYTQLIIPENLVTIIILNKKEEAIFLLSLRKLHLHLFFKPTTALIAS